MMAITLSVKSRNEHHALDFLLREKGYSVVPYVQKESLNVSKYAETIPGGLPVYTVGPEEIVAVFVGSTVATAMLNNITTDIYNAAKDWVRKRSGREREPAKGARWLRVVVYGPDEEVLGSVDFMDEGRHSETANAVGKAVLARGLVESLFDAIENEHKEEDAKPQAEGEGAS